VNQWERAERGGTLAVIWLPRGVAPPAGCCVCPISLAGVDHFSDLLDARITEAARCVMIEAFFMPDLQ
jgi:hypothetical protein